jgi:hypothetical protein
LQQDIALCLESRFQNLDFDSALTAHPEDPQLQTFLETKTILEDKKRECDRELEKVELMRDSAMSMVNTQFGIRHENHTVQTFEEEYHLPISTPKNVFKKTLFENESVRVVLAGKVDGIIEEPLVNDQPCLVEIKNRVKGFFSSLVEYEKVQIMTYMFICNLPQCFLIQTMKNNDTKLDVQLYDFDKEWFETFQKDIIHFANLYVKMTTNGNLWETYKSLQTSREKENFLSSL